MKNNFDINIPSIPSRGIKFKIQDIKTTAFGSQKNRFNENKSFLTKKFIESFSNFKEKVVEKEKEMETETEAESKAESGRVGKQEYRVFIPEEKKYMLYHLDKYKHYEAPILKETKYNRGYSFYRTQNELSSTHKHREQSYSMENPVSDSYFFPANKPKEK
jgi:hypothetical protein